MADLGTALGAAQTLFTALECSLLKEFVSVVRGGPDIEGLMRTVNTVKNVLVDAGNTKRLLSESELEYIQRLKDALYDADDLFDKYFTLAEIRVASKEPLQYKRSRLEKVRKYLPNFLTKSSKVVNEFSISREIKEIKSMFNGIAEEHAKFGFSADTQPLKRDETQSHVIIDDVVGRENDATQVISKLLDMSNSKDDIGFLTIVGLGGLGKTTLAKLVFVDERIKLNFPQRFWVFVSDQVGTPLNVKQVLLKILESFGSKLHHTPAYERVQREYQKKLRGKKFLLILDDVWTEDPLEWEKLRDFLVIGGRGSRIIVTTRSKKTASIIGSDIHELEGLSEENSLRLFERMANIDGSKPPNNNFVEMSKKIVEKCYNVPLAIKVVGSLLRGKPMDRWQGFATSGLAGTSSSMKMIAPILKFSYDQLDPSVKSCFAYCALFPKGYVINKEMILNLWEAQGYIIPFDEGQSIESAGEEYFSILLQRCFFQDVSKDEFGDLKSFKIHDLMHDLALRVSGEEVFVINDGSMLNLNNSRVRHLFDSRDKADRSGINDSKIRSYLSLEDHYNSRSVMRNIAKKWMCLRVLAFSFRPDSNLPDAMKNLIHLRYLNLSNNTYMKILPDSIATLYNLRTLILSNCRSLEGWPNEFSKLVNLTHLYRDNCENLSYMPANMSQLTNLHVLTDFVVEDESASGTDRVGQLKDLGSLAVSLKGHLVIQFEKNFKCAEGYVFEESCLKDSEHLKKVQIQFSGPWHGQTDEGSRANEEEIMGMLQPHPNLMMFELHGYMGEKIRRWGRAQDNWAAFLPNLVVIKLSNCRWLKQLPLLSRLLYLKSLHLHGLEEMEYVEETLRSSNDEITFFPCLESLEICEFKKLKEWWRGSSSNLHCQPAFPRLSQLTVTGCPDLTSFPPCPNIQTLSLRRNNEALRITTRSGVHASSSSSYDENLGLVAELDCVDHLKSLAPRLLTSLYTSNNIKTESLSEVEEVFKYCSSSLRTLEIQHYSKLTRLCGGLEHLTALNSLTLEGCTELKFEEGEHSDTSGMPWRLLHRNLRSLKLDYLNKVENLPEGMKYLTSLQHLEIRECANLKALPEWVNCFQSLRSLHIEICRALISLPQGMTELTSLQKLKIFRCPDLKERCQQPSGEDWPKIQHIPHISIP